MLTTQLANDSATLEQSLSPKFIKPYYKVNKNPKEKRRVSYNFSWAPESSGGCGIGATQIGDSTLGSDIMPLNWGECGTSWRWDHE